MSPLQDPVIHQNCERMVCKQCNMDADNICSVCRVSFEPSSVIPKYVRNTLQNIAVQCNNCTLEMSLEHWSNHWKLKCPYVCLNENCNEIISSISMEYEHLQSCEEQVQFCSHQYYGCHWKGQLKNLSNHLQKDCEFKNYQEKLNELGLIENALKSKFPKFNSNLKPYKFLPFGTTYEPLENYVSLNTRVDFYKSFTRYSTGVVTILPIDSMLGVIQPVDKSEVKRYFSWRGKQLSRCVDDLTEDQIKENLLIMSNIINFKKENQSWMQGKITFMCPDQSSILIAVQNSIHWISAPWKNQIAPAGTRAPFNFV